MTFTPIPSPLPVSESSSSSTGLTITAADAGSSTAAGANNQSIVTGSPTAGSVAQFAVSASGVKYQVTGAWVGTIVVEQSFDGGTTWVAVGLHQTGSAYTTNNFTGNFIGGQNASGATHCRARATAWTSGTANVLVVATSAPNSVYVANGISLQDSTTQTQKLSISAAGAAKVDGSAVTQPVSVSDGSDAATGAKADGAYAGSGSASMIAISKGVYSLLAAPLPSGSNQIGGVTINKVSDTSLIDIFVKILVELRTISTLLQIGLSVRDDPSDIRNDLLNNV